jgi:hypothetical protein
MHGPLLLTSAHALPTATQEYLASMKGTLGLVALYGGTAVIDDNVKGAVSDAVNL